MDIIFYHPRGGSVLRLTMRYFYAIALILLSGTAVWAAQELETQLPPAWPSLMASIRITQAIDFCGEPVDADT